MRRFTALLVLLATAAVGLTGCDMARAGTRCKAGAAPARDATHVLFCQKGRWVRTLTIGEAAEILLGGRVSSVAADSATLAGKAGGGSDRALKVTVTSRNGKPVAGATVVLSGPTSGPGLGSGTQQSAETGSDGVAQFGLIVLGGAAGTFDLVATVRDTDVSTKVAVTVRPDVSASTQILSGGNQTVPAGALLAPVSVRLLDRFGNPVPGGRVVAFRDFGEAGIVVAAGADGTATFAGVSAIVALPALGVHTVYLQGGNTGMDAIGTFTYTSTSS